MNKKADIDDTAFFRCDKLKSDSFLSKFMKDPHRTPKPRRNVYNNPSGAGVPHR